MSNVDSRIVEMKFNKGDFEKGVNDTIRALENLKKGLALEGATKGLDEVNNASKRFSLRGILDGFGSLTGIFGKVTSGFSSVTSGLTGVSNTFGKIGAGFTGLSNGISSGLKAVFNPIDTFKSKLKLDGATAGMAQVQSQANKMNFAPLNSAVAGVGGQFSAMQIAATTALATIVNKVTKTAGMIGKALTITPITSGFSEYEQKLGAIQTIMAGSGEKLDVVNKKLGELNEYSDKTIYSFADMTQSIGKFTNAGVSLDESVASIKGIANVAALSGANSNEASRAMYNFAQALSAGYVKLLDWKSIELANMGTVEFKQQLIDSAVAMGTLTKKGDSYVTSAGNSLTATKGFNESLTDAWLSSEALTSTLGKYSDASTDIGKRATAAASDVKTMSQMFDTLKESAQSGWAETWEIVFGDFNEAKKLFTGVNNVIGGMIGRWAEARNSLLANWDARGGRIDLIESIKNAWNALLAVIAPIKEAFREIFPAKTGRDLAIMTSNLREFTAGLKIGGETADGLKRTFKGVFAIFSIAKQVIGAVAGAIGDLFGKVGENSGGILNFTGSIADFIVALDEMLKKSGVLKKFFSGLAAVLQIPFALLGGLAKLIGGLFVNFDSSGAEQVSDAIDSVREKMDPLKAAADRVGIFLGKIGSAFAKVGSTIGNALSGIGEAIASAFSGTSFDKVLGVIQTGLLGGILLTLKRFFKGGDVSIDFGGGLLSSAKDALQGVSDTMQNMQQNLKANILLKIAAAMGIMAVAIAILATIDADRLKSALAGMAIGIGIMGGAMAGLMKAMSSAGLVQLYVITAAFTKVAISLLLIATALKILASLDIGDTIQALIAMGGALAVVAMGMRLMPKGIAAQSAALILLGAGLIAIATAMKIFGTMEWEEIGRGLAVMAGALTAIAVGMRLMPKGILLQAAALMALGLALNAMGTALKIFATMSWQDIGRGLATLAGALLAIAVAMRLMPFGPNMVLQAAGLLAVSVAINILSVALKTMGGMSWDEIGKGLATLGGSLLILAGGLRLMNGTLGGAAALVIAAGALAVLTPILITLGNLDWGTIVKGLVTIAATFAIFAAGGYLLAGTVPIFLGLAAAMLIFGAGVALVGVGVAALGIGFAAIVAAAAGAVQVLAQLIGQFLSSIGAIAKAIAVFLANMVLEIMKAAPKIISGFVDILIKFFEAVVTAAPKIVAGLVKILTNILDGIISIAPKIGQAFLAILTTLINVVITATPKIGQLFLTLLNTALAVIVAAVPRIAAAGIAVITALLTALATAIPRIVPLALEIIASFLRAIASKLDRVISAAVDVVVAFLKGIGDNLERVIQAGADLIIKFINGVAEAIRNNAGPLADAGVNLATAIIEGMVKGLWAGISGVASAAKDVAKSALKGAMGVLGIKSPSKEFEKIGEYVIEGFVKGLTGNADDVENALSTLTDMITTAQQSAEDSIESLKEKQKELTRARLDDNIAVRDATKALAEAKKNKDTDALDLEKATRNLADAIAKRQENIQAIKDNERAIAQLSAEYITLRNTNAAVNRQFKDDKIALQELATEYDSLVEQLDTANKALDDAIAARDNYQKSIADSYSDLPNIDNETSVDGYIQDMLSATEKTERFTEVLGELRDLGLNDELYKELLAKGTDALPFVEQILQGGIESVKMLNLTSENMKLAAEKLGDDASAALFQAGVDTIQGLVDGIKSRKSAVINEMEVLAETMLSTMKSKLGIASPSKRFAEIGRYANEGMAKGLKDYSSVVSKSADNVGKEALRSLKASMANLSDVVISEMDTNPTIRPVLDLSDVKKKSLQINGMMAGKDLNLGVAYSNAQKASLGYQNNRIAARTEQSELVGASRSVTFIQNNTSPKALSAGELYRQTNNQISTAKGVLTK